MKFDHAACPACSLLLRRRLLAPVLHVQGLNVKFLSHGGNFFVASYWSDVMFQLELFSGMPMLDSSTADSRPEGDTDAAAAGGRLRSGQSRRKLSTIISNIRGLVLREQTSTELSAKPILR